MQEGLRTCSILIVSTEDNIKWWSDSHHHMQTPIKTGIFLRFLWTYLSITKPLDTILTCVNMFQVLANYIFTLASKNNITGENVARCLYWSFDSDGLVIRRFATLTELLYKLNGTVLSLSHSERKRKWNFVYVVPIHISILSYFQILKVCFLSLLMMSNMKIWIYLKMWSFECQNLSNEFCEKSGQKDSHLPEEPGVRW